MARREDYELKRLPRSVWFMTGAADIQIDRIEFHRLGDGVASETWAVSHEVF